MTNDPASIVTLFSIPKAFEGHIGTIQRNALQSWIKLKPRPQIILFGNETGTAEVCLEFDLIHVSMVERNEFGTPLIHSIFKTAQQLAQTSCLAFVNTDIILLSSFAGEVARLPANDRTWLAVGRRHDLMIWDEIDFSSPEWETELTKQVDKEGMLDASSGIDYFIFTKGLFESIPPFAIGRTYWDNWLLRHALQNCGCLIDATRRIMIIHQDHSYMHVKGGSQEIWNGIEAKRNWELAQGEAATIRDANFCLDESGVVPIYDGYALPEPMMQDIFDLKYMQSVSAYNRGAYETALDLLEYVRIWSRDNILPEGYLPHFTKVKQALESHFAPVSASTAQAAVLSAISESNRLFRRGRHDDAINILLHKGIAIDQYALELYLTLADQLIITRRYEDALEALTEAPDPTSQATVLERMAICLAALGDEQHAKSCAQAALHVKCDSARSLEVMGILAARHGRFDEAGDFFQRAYKSDPERGEPLAALGMLAWNSGDFKESYHLLRRAVELTPLDTKTVELFYEAALRLEQHADFIALLQEIHERMADCRDIILALASALAEKGENEKGLELTLQGLATIGCDDALLNHALELRRSIGFHEPRHSDALDRVSLCMIVKNEEKYLAQCLVGLRHVVDEMLVVDTGSTDRTVKIAEAFGSRIFEFEWNDNFSDARNFSLSNAIGKWIIVMDADEALSEQDYPAFKEALRRSIEKQTAWSVTTRNYTNRVETDGWQANNGSYAPYEKGDGWYPSSKVRLFPAMESIRFSGDIHEMVEPDIRKCGIPIEQAQFVIHHYGELADEDRRAKQLRYYELGKQKLKEHPNDKTAITELAIQAGELEMFDEALKMWDDLLARGVASRDVYFNRSYVLMGMQRFSEASEMARKTLEIDPHHKESAYNYGMCLLNLAKPEQAIEIVRHMSEKYPDYPLLMALLCVLYLSTGEHEEGLALYGEIKNRNYAIADYIRERIAVLNKPWHTELALQLRQAADKLGILR